MIFSSANQFRPHKLEISQKMDIRNICKAKYIVSTKPLFNHLWVPKLADIFKIKLIKYICLYTKGMLAELLEQYCQQIREFIPKRIDIFGILTLLHI